MNKKILISFCLFAGLLATLLAQDRLISSGLLLLVARDNGFLKAYLQPRDDSVVEAGALVLKEDVYQMIRLKDGRKTVVYSMRFSPEYSDVVNIRDSACFCLQTNGVWDIDETPPAEAPLGGLATREKWIEVNAALLKAKPSESVSWTNLLQKASGIYTNRMTTGEGQKADER